MICQLAHEPLFTIATIVLGPTRSVVDAPALSAVQDVPVEQLLMSSTWMGPFTALMVTFQGSPPDVKLRKLALPVIGLLHVVVIIGWVPPQTVPSKSPLPPAVATAALHDVPCGTWQNAPLQVLPLGQVVVHGPSVGSCESTGESTIGESCGASVDWVTSGCGPSETVVSAVTSGAAAASPQLAPHVRDESTLHAATVDAATSEAKIKRISTVYTRLATNTARAR